MATGADRERLISLWQAIERASHRHHQKFSLRPRRGLNELLLIRQVHATPGITLSELARQVGVAKSHASKTTDAFARGGLIEKRPDSEDQRLVRLYPTGATEERWAQMNACARGVWRDVFDAIPAEEVEGVGRALSTLLGALEHVNREDGGPAAGAPLEEDR